MSIVLVDGLNVRAGPSAGSEKVAQYNSGQIIKSGNLLTLNENRIWLRYTASSGNQRFVCALNNDGAAFVAVPLSVPGPRSNGKGTIPEPNKAGGTGIPGIPKQTQFPDVRIQKYGCCFLCTCVKGGLTTFDQCMNCFNWGLNSGKLSRTDCYVNCDKENWAKEISSKYGTPYHSGYNFKKIFTKDGTHFLITQNGIEIFNSMGIGWSG